MNIGGKRITGVQPRFFVLIGGTIAVIIFMLMFASRTKQTVNYLYDPAFATTELTTPAFTEKDWLAPYISDYGITRPSSSQEVADNFTQYMGVPLRFKVYLPDPESVKDVRKDLLFIKYGLSFVPGVIISPDQALNADDISEMTSTEIQDQPIVLGFKNSSTPPGGQAYEVTGMLYWRSDLINPDGAARDDQQHSPSPVVIVSSYNKLAPAELRAPTTQKLDLEMNVQEGPTLLSLSALEWSSGRELRACVTLTNTSTRSVPVWSGITSMTADSGDSGAVTGQPDENSALGAATDLQPSQSLSGYIVFGQTVSDPNQALHLTMPTLVDAVGSDESRANRILVDVPVSNAKTVNNSETTGCGTTRSTGSDDSGESAEAAFEN